MDDHFRAFSFVDRLQPAPGGMQIRGSYFIPPGIAEFPGSIVAESVGQLAAWASMLAVDFKTRPVAGIASRVELLGPASPGHTLELSAELDTVDTEAVSYNGTATVNGKVILRLEHCVGPMMPVEEFDDPQLLRNRLSLLSGAGATPGVFGGVPAIACNRTTGEVGKVARATLQVPTDAPFFADHFPRRPVFPGSLLMHSQLELAGALAAEIAPPAAGTWSLREIIDMKLRSFIPPGALLEMEVKLVDRKETSILLSLESRREQRLVGAARVLLSTEVMP